MTLCKTADVLQWASAGCRRKFADQPALAFAQARLPEIEELQKQITASCEELAELDFKATEERVAAAAREAAVKVHLLTVAQRSGASQGTQSADYPPWSIASQPCSSQRECRGMELFACPLRRHRVWLLTNGVLLIHRRSCRQPESRQQRSSQL